MKHVVENEGSGLSDRTHDCDKSLIIRKVRKSSLDNIDQKPLKLTGQQPELLTEIIILNSKKKKPPANNKICLQWLT